MLSLALDPRGSPYAHIANAALVLESHPEIKGKIWFDSFRRKIYHTTRSDIAQLWTDADTRRMTAWMQQNLEIHKMSGTVIDDAVQLAGERNQRNSLTEWLEGLVWDGTERLDTWLSDCLGAERNPYNDAVARNWPISMVARAFSPGCQVDTMPVLEGQMGRGKSRFLDVLASPWFAALQIAFGEKDFFQAIQGRWLIEVPDMSGFSRREHTQILATITTRVDVFRKSHGRITEEYPRVTVFAATSETDDYLADSRGRRRYWPLRCGDISLEALAAQREQVFAEALIRYRAGEGWWHMPGATDEEQLARTSQDLWTENVLYHADTLWDERDLTRDARITSTLLLTKIGVELHRQADADKARIARIMRANGWVQRNNQGRFWNKVIRRKET